MFQLLSLRLQIFSLRKEYSKRPSICISPVIRRESFGSNIAGNVANGSDIGRYKSQFDVFDIAVIANHSLFRRRVFVFQLVAELDRGARVLVGVLEKRAACIVQIKIVVTPMKIKSQLN